MSTEKGKILEFKQYMKSNKIPYVIYADIESLIRKIDGCVNNPNNLQQQNQASLFLVDIQCEQFGYLIIYKTSILYVVEKVEWKIVRFFCESLREHAKNIIAFEKKKMLALNKRRINNISSRWSMLYLQKKNPKRVSWRYSMSKSHRSMSLYR